MKAKPLLSGRSAYILSRWSVEKPEIAPSRSVRTGNKPRAYIYSVGGEREQHEDPNNLTLYRWRHPLPKPDEEAELVRRAKAGDQAAATQIVKNYHRLIVGIAGRHRINGVREDLIGRGFEALWRAVLDFDPSQGASFAAYAKRCIGGQVSDEAKTFIKRGSAGETRIERWLFSHPKASPRQLVDAFEKRGIDISAGEAADEIRQFKARCSWRRYRPPDDGKDDPWD